MRKLKAIWRLMWSNVYVLYTSKYSHCMIKENTGNSKLDHNTQDWHSDLIIAEKMINDQIEASESVEYVKSLLTEI